MRKLLISVATLAALAAGLPAMANELRIGLQDDPDMLDPDQSRTFVGRIVYTAMCDKLVDLDQNVQIVPQLATDWSTSEDGLHLVMNLREGVVFQDGTPFNAEAVVANINRSLTLPESRRKSELASVDSVEATGPLQVTFNLKTPDASLLAQLSDRAGMMISPTAAKAEGADFAQNPVCSGPFKFVERVAQDRIVLEKFPDYWNAKNIHIDRVVYLPIPDSTVRLANLQSGQLDMVDRLAATDVAAVKDDPKLELQKSTGLGFMRLIVNVGNGDRSKTDIGQSKLIRQAFSKAIDREALNQVVFNGTATAGNQPWAPSSPWYDKDLPLEPRDLEGAKKLLKEAGVEHPKVEILHANNTITTQEMQVIQAMVAEAGFDVSLRATEFATMLQQANVGNFQMARSDWSGRADPDGNIHQFITCKGSLNSTGYCNPKVDELLNSAREISDPAERKKKYDAAMAIILDDMPLIFLGHQSYLTAYDKGVGGFKAYPDGMIRLTGVTDAD